MGVQLFVYSPRVWRGHSFYTAMHVLFTVLWTYVAGTYAGALWKIL
jgi:hypothetical protein